MHRKPCPFPGKITVDLFCPLWWVANKNEVRQAWSVHASHRWKFEQTFALSERLRCETKENKVCICRHSNLEMLLRVMPKLVSYGRLGGSVFFVPWSEFPTFESHYANSGAFLINYWLTIAWQFSDAYCQERSWLYFVCIYNVFFSVHILYIVLA